MYTLPTNTIYGPSSEKNKSGNRVDIVSFYIIIKFGHVYKEIWIAAIPYTDNYMVYVHHSFTPNSKNLVGI